MNWCKLNTYFQDLLGWCEISLRHVDYPVVTPFRAELRLLLLVLRQRLELAQMVLLTLDVSSAELWLSLVTLR